MSVRDVSRIAYRKAQLLYVNLNDVLFDPVGVSSVTASGDHDGFGIRPKFAGKLRELEALELLVAPSVTRALRTPSL